MITIILSLVLTTNVSCLQRWFQVPGGSAYSMTTAGTKQDYFIQGKRRKVGVFQIDLVNGASTNPSNLDFGPVFFSSTGYYANDYSNNIIIAAVGDHLARFDLQSGTGSFENFNLPNIKYLNPPKYAENTNFIFVFAGNNPVANYKLYRVITTGNIANSFKSFTVTSPSFAYGVLSGTNWVLASLTGSSKRILMDYTNGFDGGSSSATQQHSKTGPNKEASFMSPGGGQGVYLTAGDPGKTVYVTNVATGAEHLKQHLNHLPHDTFPAMAWIYETNLAVILNLDTSFAIMDFMDTSFSTAPVYEFLVDGEGNNLSVQVSRDYKAMILSSDFSTKSIIYKLDKEMPCKGLCATCDGVDRNKCVSCKAIVSRGQEIPVFVILGLF